MGFFVWQCRDCYALTDDPKEHTKRSGHVKGYEKIYVPDG